MILGFAAIGAALGGVFASTTSLIAISTGISLGALAGQLLYGLLFPKHTHTYGPRLKDKDVQISTYGAAIVRLWGTGSIAGNVIWVGRRIEITIEHEQGKGGSATYTEYRYKQSFAIAFCEGNANTKLMKLWFDSKPIYNITSDNEEVVKKNVKWVFYPGSETQIASSIIEREKGSGNVPGYRGICYIVFDRVDITNWGNRLPNVRGLIGKASFSPLSQIKAVPGYPGDGFNRDRYYSLQILMSVNEEYIICHEWDYINSGIWFYKISTLTNQQISSRFFGWNEACLSDDICKEDSGGACGGTYWDIFGWHHPACLDERGKVYAASCDGAGRVYRLNSDTWQWEAKSPEWPGDETVYEAMHPGWDAQYSYTEMKLSRVSQNPEFPFLWLNTASCEQGALGPMRVYLINRNTMGSPYNSAAWAYPIQCPSSMICDGTPSSAGYAKPGAFCLDNTTGRCYIMWTDAYSAPQQWFLSRFDPLTKEYIAADISGTAGLNWTAAWAHLGYDPDSDTLVFFYWDAAAGKSYVCFYDGDLNYITKVEVDDEFQACNDGEDNFIRVVQSKFYVGNYYGGNPIGGTYYVSLYEINCAARSVTKIWTVPYDNPSYGNIYQIVQSVYCSLKESLYCEVEYSTKDDTMLKEIRIGAYDPSTVPLYEIVGDICSGHNVPSGLQNFTQLTDDVWGYMIQDRITGKDQLRPLQDAFLWEMAEIDGYLTGVKRGNAPIVTIPHTDLGYHYFGESDGDRPLAILKQNVARELTLPWSIDVHYWDKDTVDYRVGVQSARRGPACVETRHNASVQLPVVMSGDGAKQLAEIYLSLVWHSRPTFEGPLPPKYMWLAPTDVVEIQESIAGTLITHQVLLTEVTVGDHIVEVQAVGDKESLYTSDAVGEPIPPGNDQIDYTGPSYFHLIESEPLVNSHDEAGVYVCSGSPGLTWPGCDIYVTKDNRLTWEVFAKLGVRAKTGVALDILGTFARPGLIDFVNSFKVRFDQEDDTISGISNEEFMNSILNTALVGDEVIRFRDVQDNGDGTWTISTLLRGIKGSEWAIDGHVSGERFIILSTNTVLFRPLPVDYKDKSFIYQGVTAGDDFGTGVEKAYETIFRVLKPYSPANVRGSRDVSNNLTGTWDRRARINNGWLDGQDLPLDEPTEEYEVDILVSGSVVRTFTGLTDATFSYTAAQQTTDGITPGNDVDVAVYQISSRVGRGWPAYATI